MTQNTDQDRTEFEEWASDEFGYSGADFTQTGGRYILDHLYFGYQGWQAARRAQVVEFLFAEPLGWRDLAADALKVLTYKGNYGSRDRRNHKLATIANLRTTLAAAPQPPEVEHPWAAYLNARKVAIHHYHAEGRSFDDIAAVLNLADSAHVERIYNATSAKVEPHDQSSKG